MADEVKIIKMNTGTSSMWRNQARPMEMGELGYDSDMKKLKVGDGSESFEDLDGLVKDSELENRIAAAESELREEIETAREDAVIYAATKLTVSAVTEDPRQFVVGKDTGTVGAIIPIGSRIKVNGKTSTVTGINAWTPEGTTVVTTDSAVLEETDVGKAVAYAVEYVPVPPLIHQYDVLVMAEAANGNSPTAIQRSGDLAYWLKSPGTIKKFYAQPVAGSGGTVTLSIAGAQTGASLTLNSGALAYTDVDIPIKTGDRIELSFSGVSILGNVRCSLIVEV